MQPLWKTVRRLLNKLKIELPYVLEIALLCIYPKDTKIQIQRDTCILIFIAALSTIAYFLKDLKFLLTDGWIKRGEYIWNLRNKTNDHRGKMIEANQGNDSTIENKLVVATGKSLRR